MSGRREPSPPADGSGSATGCDSSVQSCPHAKSLKGEVVAVTWGSDIKTSHRQATIVAPHWEVGLAVYDGSGSKRAGAYLIEGKGKDRLKVKVRITENINVSGDSTLSGQLGTLKMTGTCPTAVGEHEVNAKIEKRPDAIRHFQGDVSWGLEVPDLAACIGLGNSTRLEVFVILDDPAGFYDPPGVWVEALRFVCDTVGANGLKTGAEVVAKVATYLHGSHGLGYDTRRGAPAYGVSGSGGTFKLKDYLAAAARVVNCYDQAGGVQALCGAVGVDTTWYYLDPYGFINTTNLVGVGNCNNPFFLSNGSSAVVPADDPKRTAFGNHAFCGLAGKVLDACAGPHTGTETKAQYCAAAIDATPALYARYSGFRPGTAADIVEPGGITGLA